MNSVSSKKLKIIGAFLATALLYLYFSSPGKVVVNDKGDVKGLMNKARQCVQGKKFWKDQLHKVRSKLEWELGAPQREAELDLELRRMDEKIDQKNPIMRPTAAEIQAEALREKAFLIEQNEINRTVEEYRIERISRLQRILPIVEAKTKR